MMRAVRCCAVLAAGSALAVACASFSSDATPTPGPSDAAPSDASTGDAGTTDASSPDAPSGPFCASLTPKPIFCVDFDEDPSAATGFDEELGTVALDSRFVVSAPASLLALTVDGGGTPESISRLGRTLTSGTTSQKVSFMIRLGDDDGGNPPQTPYGIVLRLIVDGWNVDLDVANAGLGYLDFLLQYPDGGAQDDRVTLLRRPPPGVWTKVELRLTTTGGNVRAELDIGGQPAIDPYTSLIPKLSSSPRIYLGLIYSSNAVVRYDNVVFDGN